jgi:hypothetical protein
LLAHFKNPVEAATLLVTKSQVTGRRKVQGRQTSGSDGPERPVYQATMTNLAIAANGVFLGVVFVTGCGP